MVKLQQYAELYPTRGFDDYFGKIRNEGLVWNRKRVLRVYRGLQMKLRRKHKKRLPARVKEPLAEPLQLNHTWSLDFMSDALTSGRRIRIFKAMDDGSRESLAAHADYSISAEKVIMITPLLVFEYQSDLLRLCWCSNINHIFYSSSHQQPNSQSICVVGENPEF